MAHRKKVLIALSVVAACATNNAPREPEPVRASIAKPIDAAPLELPALPPIASTSAEPLRPLEHFALNDELGRSIDVYPPSSKTTSIVVVLHATCMQPASVCDWFGAVGRETGWLVCPSGNSSCNGEPDWHGPGPEKAAFLDRAIAHVEAALPTFVDETPGVLVGWSRGAYAARDILYTVVDEPDLTSLRGRFRGVVFMAAQVTPDVTKLRAAGVTRVVMAAGEQDGSVTVMKAAVARLNKQGFEARFVSFGKIGHTWPEDFEARMREPIAWAGGADP